MKQKDIMILVGIGVIAAIFAYVISGAIFSSPKQRSAEVPVIPQIAADFPDVQSETQYQSFFNTNALDPTQLIKIGDNKNATPFNTPIPQ